MLSGTGEALVTGWEHWLAIRQASPIIPIVMVRQTNQILSRPGMVILITSDLVRLWHGDLLAHQQLLISLVESLAEGGETPIATVVG